MTRDLQDEFSGWSSYPQNLELSPLEADTRLSAERLSSSKGRLFDDKDESQIEVLGIGHKRTNGLRDVECNVVRSSSELSACFKQKYPPCMFFLHQNYSWAQLKISEELLKKLFTKLKVHPDFLEVLFTFGEKVGPVEEGLGSFFSHCQPLRLHDLPIGFECSYDFGYNIKYVARHNRSFPKDPFSLREMGIYHRFDASTKASNWVFIQASDSLKDQLKRCFSMNAETEPMIQFKIHGVVLRDASAGWRDYLLYLEDKFSNLAERVIFANMKGPKPETDVDISDIRELQILKGKLRRLLHILKLNIDMVEQMRHSILRIKKHSPSLNDSFDQMESTIDTFTFQHRTHAGRLQSVIDRAHDINSLIQNILDVRSAESSRSISSRMKELAEQGIHENKLIKGMTIKMTQDTKSMSLIALLSAIFLPATLLAAVFGTNFFDFQSGKLETASNFWLYPLLAILFSAIMTGFWFLWWRRVKQKFEAGEVDTEACLEK